ncbi:MAG TPA: TIGR03435 family protein [Acidobacteriaceae bacterium]
MLILAALPFTMHAVTAQTAPGSDHSSAELTHYSIIAIHPQKSLLENGEVQYSNATVDGIALRGATLETLLTSALDVQPNQIAGIPHSLSTGRYDLTARVDPDEVAVYRVMTGAQKRVMLQSLLTERFGLRYHQELRPLHVYELVAAKNGTKLKNPANSIFLVSAGRGHLEAKNAPLSTLTDLLTPETGRIVLNKTGLQGNYDYTLSWDPENQPSPSSPRESDTSGGNRDKGSLFSALVEQLGLRLEAKTDPVVTFVVDHIAPPAEN